MYTIREFTVARVGKVRRQVLVCLIFSWRVLAFSSGMSLLFTWRVQFLRSGSKKGQVKMGTAAGFSSRSRMRFGFCSVDVVSAAFMLSFCFNAHVFSAQPASLMLAWLAGLCLCFRAPLRGEIARGESESTDDFFLSLWFFA